MTSRLSEKAFDSSSYLLNFSNAVSAVEMKLLGRFPPFSILQWHFGYPQAAFLISLGKIKTCVLYPACRAPQLPSVASVEVV